MLYMDSGTRLGGPTAEVQAQVKQVTVWEVHVWCWWCSPRKIGVVIYIALIGPDSDCKCD